jgi:hypothetical protein
VWQPLLLYLKPRLNAQPKFSLNPFTTASFSPSFPANMAEACRITNPSQLARGAPKLGIEASATDSTLSEGLLQTPPTTLVLLQPLANPDMLTACHPPNTFTEYQYLNIQPLSLEWRQALINITPITHLILDLTLPRPLPPSSSSGELEFQKIYWDTGIPSEGGTAVLTRDVMTMVLTIATGMRMRADGVLKFEVMYDLSEGVTPNAMRLLQKHLMELEKEYKKTSDSNTALRVEDVAIGKSGTT